MQNHCTRIKMAPTNAAALSPRSDDSETSSSFSAEAIIALVALFLMVAVPCTGYIFRAHAKGWLRSAKHWYRRLKRQGVCVHQTSRQRKKLTVYSTRSRGNPSDRHAQRCLDAIGYGKCTFCGFQNFLGGLQGVGSALERSCTPQCWPTPCPKLMASANPLRSVAVSRHRGVFEVKRKGLASFGRDHW